MELSNLTTSGWVLFGFAMLMWIISATHLIAIARGEAHENGEPAAAFAITAILTVWLLWLVTP